VDATQLHGVSADFYCLIAFAIHRICTLW